MSEASDAGGMPADVTRLLYKAVKALPEDEQAVVFQYFLRQGVGFGLRHEVRQTWYRDPPVTAALVKSAGPNQQIIPVRLSEESHRRLKTWCADHDFHMSVVVRGLIERFLDGWKEPAEGRSAAD